MTVSGAGPAGMVAAAVLAASAAALLAGPAGAAPPEPAHPQGLSAGRRGTLLLLGTTVLAVPAAGLEPRRLALGVILLGCGGAVAGVVRRARAASRADHRRRAVVEVAEALAGELRAGRPPQAALERAVEVWAPFEVVASAGRLGADVPSALARLAAEPGAEDLQRVASAWQVSAESGSGLAATLTQVAASVRAMQATRLAVAAELASAQATARLVGVLPLAVLTMAAGVGGRPWQFLLQSPLGLACLAAGAGLGFAGLWWIDRIAAGVLRR